jgi:hypothetical protein
MSFAPVGVIENLQRVTLHVNEYLQHPETMRINKPAWRGGALGVTDNVARLILAPKLACPKFVPEMPETRK